MNAEYPIIQTFSPSESSNIDWPFKIIPKEMKIHAICCRLDCFSHWYVWKIVKLLFKHCFFRLLAIFCLRIHQSRSCFRHFYVRFSYCFCSIFVSVSLRNHIDCSCLRFNKIFLYMQVYVKNALKRTCGQMLKTEKGNVSLSESK